ncbi:MAG: hypothetical protein ACLFV2_10045 [Desulfurivibrionaceae bacterium]
MQNLAVAKGIYRKILLVLTVMVIMFLTAGHSLRAEALENGEMLENLGSLKLGFDGYFIGHALNDDQLDLARGQELEESFKGTYKFRDQQVSVVASRKDNIILAVFKRYDGVGSEDLKTGVAETMDRFGEPTTMAHDKMIYWAYDKDGKIGEERFNQLKSKGDLQVLATVKFDSSVPLDRVENNEGEEINYYIMISSQPVLESFLQKNKLLPDSE